MKCKIVSSLIFVSIVNVSNLEKITGCYFSGAYDPYYGQITEELQFYCTEPNFYGNYDFDECFDNAFRYQNWPYVQTLSTGTCTGNRLDTILRNVFTHIQAFDISSYGIEFLSSEDLKFPQLAKFIAPHNSLTNLSGSLFIYTPN